MEVATFFFIAAGVLALWASFRVGSRAGLSEASRFIVEGFSLEVEPKSRSEAYEEVSKAYNEVKERLKRIHSLPLTGQGSLRRLRCVELGRAIACSAIAEGAEMQHTWSAPNGGEIRVELTFQELKDIHWLAHYGFEHMIWNTREAFTFKDKEDATKASRAVSQLERLLPKDPDDSDPYALSFNRETMIWERWPSKA